MFARTLLASLSLLTGCLHQVELEVLKPAEIMLPGDVRVLGVIDRSAPANAGQHVLGAIEGALSGEDLGADRAGASQAVERLINELAASPRFDVVVPIARPRDVRSDVFDTVLDNRTARRLAKQVGADALVSLEVFDSDADLEVTRASRTEEVDGREVRYLEYTATRTTLVTAGWRIYDPGRGALLDERGDLRYSETEVATARERQAAVAGLPAPTETVMAIGELVGAEYGTRIAPHYVWVKRSYFGSGDDRLKQARRLVQSDQWERAARVWEALAQDPDPKVAARALHNLGVYHEIGGRIVLAIEVLGRAVELGGRGASMGYLRELRGRLVEDAVLGAQMEGVGR